MAPLTSWMCTGCGRTDHVVMVATGAERLCFTCYREDKPAHAAIEHRKRKVKRKGTPS